MYVLSARYSQKCYCPCCTGVWAAAERCSNDVIFLLLQSIVLVVRCMVDFVAPKGLEAVAPIVCPRYQEDGCCTWQQNYALYQNLGTLVDRYACLVIESDPLREGREGKEGVSESNALAWLRVPLKV